MPPSWNQNGINMDAKIESFLDAFENRFWIDFFYEFVKENGGKMAPKSMKNRCDVRKTDF